MRSILLIACCFMAGTISARDTALPDGPYISTSAEAEEALPPDFATMDLSVRLIDASPEAVRQRIDAAQERILTVLAAFKDAIREQRIIRLSFGENWEYDRERQQQVLAGYHGSFDFEVQVADFDRLNALQHRLAALEFQSLQGPRFDLTPESRALLERRAREQAVRAATQRAEQLAATQGAELGSIWGIIHQPMHELAGTVPGGASAASEVAYASLDASRRDGEFAMAFEPQPIRFRSSAGVVYRLIPAQP